MKKRGLSTVVTTLILIVLVLVAVGIIWAVISNMINTEIDDIGAGVSRVTLDIIDNSVKVNPNTDEISLKIKRGIGEGNLVKIKYIISDFDNEDSGELNASNLGKLEMDKFKMGFEGLVKENITKIQIAPIIETEAGKEKLMPVTDTYAFDICIPDCEGKDCGSDGCGDVCGVCDEGYTCKGGLCTACGNDVVNDDEECDFGLCEGDEPSSGGGNSFITCNKDEGEGVCTTQCELYYCGDNLVNAYTYDGLGEQCDDGDNVNGDECSSQCKLELTCEEKCEKDYGTGDFWECKSWSLGGIPPYPDCTSVGKTSVGYTSDCVRAWSPIPPPASVTSCCCTVM